MDRMRSLAGFHLDSHGWKAESSRPVTSHTAPLTSAQAETLRRLLEERGYDFETKPHALFSARKGKLNVTVYQKGPKVLVQGKDTEDFIRFILEPEVLGEAKLGYEEILEPDKFEPHFGIDESGKGDFFGPLVIAGVYTDAVIARHLIDAGVMDSKRVTSAARIRKLAAAIRATPGCTSDVVSIGPESYNRMHASFGNLNRLLAWGHARVIEKPRRRPPGLPAHAQRPVRPARSAAARPPRQRASPSPSNNAPRASPTPPSPPPPSSPANASSTGSTKPPPPAE